MMGLMKSNIQSIRERLLRADPEIVEIVQFGSSVYAPKDARDLDLLIFTKRKRPFERYMDAITDLDLPFNTDIVVKNVGKPLMAGFAWQVLGAYQVIHGDGKCIREIVNDLEDPTFEEAWACTRVARESIVLAGKKRKPIDRDRWIRSAFDNLFHAARMASMVYLATEETRWGAIKKMLPPRYGQGFKTFINTLHVKYAYEGNYPRANPKRTFERWAKKVEGYVRDLEAKTAT